MDVPAPILNPRAAEDITAVAELDWTGFATMGLATTSAATDGAGAPCRVAVPGR